MTGISVSRRCLATIGAAAALVIAVSACGGLAGVEGRQAPTSGAASPTRATAASSTVARPREMPLDVADPCALLTPQQRTALAIDTPGRLVLAPYHRSVECAWTVIGADHRLVAVTVEGVSAWTGGERAGRATATAPVLDYPAITVTLPGDDRRCDVMVDTAEGQYLAATFSVRPSFEDRFPTPCDGARRLAEAAMRTLLD